MKKKFSFFKLDTVGHWLIHIALAVLVGFGLIITFFYLYLPNATKHGDSVVVPDVLGIEAVDLDSLLSLSNLRLEINDSAYSEDYGPLQVIHQFPQSGRVVKPNRKIYVTINQMKAPSVPIPDIVDVSLINAIATLKSNELRTGNVIYEPSPFNDLVLEIRIDGLKVEPGTRIPKGTTIDLVVGDGAGPNQLVIPDLIKYDYETAKLMIAKMNLLLGQVIVPESVDTTGVVSFVFKQEPVAGDSARIGDPVTIWLCPENEDCKADTVGLR